MYFIVGSIVILLFAVIIIFAFPQFSPIPYFPSNAKDMPLILKALSLRNHQTIIDLGAGDGIVIFKSAKKAYKEKLNTQFIAVEINPLLLLILYVRRMLHPNKKNIKILNRDMFTCIYKNFLSLEPSNFLTFFMYISPWFIEKTVSNIVKQTQEFDLVSYFYQVNCLPKHKEELQEGVHKVFSYRHS
jgi:hypothetical protein